MSESSQWDKNQRKNKSFQCPCGKSYLSYPALYTHIKQSHAGRAPGEIKRPDSHNRGRPKASGSNKFQQHNKYIEQQLKVDPIPDLINLVESISMQQSSKNRQVRQIYIHQPVYKLIMNDKNKPFHPTYLKDDHVYDVKMGQGIMAFLNQIQPKIQNKNIYDQIVMLIVLLSEHIIEETEDQNVLSLGTVGLMPQFVNYFIMHDFRKPVERLKLQKFWIFQQQNAILILNLLFKWMLFKKYTLTKVIINEKYFHPEQVDEEDDEQGFDGDDNDNSNQQKEQNQGYGSQENQRGSFSANLQSRQHAEKNKKRHIQEKQEQNLFAQVRKVHRSEPNNDQSLRQIDPLYSKQ